jgi:hypothetical protein
MASLRWLFAVIVSGVCALAQPVITQNPQSLTKAPGTLAAFSVAASGAEPLSYQWQFNGQDIPNARGRSLRFVTAPSRGGTYRAIVRDQAGQIRSSAAATLEVKPKPKIVVQPVSAVVQEGTTAVFEVQLNDSGPYTYINWYNYNPVEGRHAIPEGAARNVHTTRLQIPNSLNAFNYNGTYWIAVSNEVGGTVSRKVKLTVVSPPQIWSHPDDRAVRRGSSVSFSVSVTRDNAGTKRYQWYRDGQPLPGAVSRVLHIGSAQPQHEGLYYCVVSSAGGATESGSAALTVF